MHRAAPAILAMTLLVAGCAKVPATVPGVARGSNPAIAEIVAEYRMYRPMTDVDVFVNPEFAMRCVGVSQAEVEVARGSKGPHAHSAIRVLMNDSAAQTFARGDSAYAPGAVIVKRKMLQATRSATGAGRSRPIENGVGGMVKRAPGFDPANGDWEYFYFDDATRIESGRMASCIACHAVAKSTDYVFGTWAERARIPARL